MHELLGINSQFAQYYADDHGIETAEYNVDPHRYLKTLLSIRSPTSLIDFIRAFPVGLLEPISGNLPFAASPRLSPRRHFAFLDNQRLVAKAAERRGVNYFNEAFPNAILIPGEEITRNCRKDEMRFIRSHNGRLSRSDKNVLLNKRRTAEVRRLSYLNFTDVASLQVCVEGLLRLAAVYYKREPYDAYITVDCPPMWSNPANVPWKNPSDVFVSLDLIRGALPPNDKAYRDELELNRALNTYCRKHSSDFTVFDKVVMTDRRPNDWVVEAGHGDTAYFNSAFIDDADVLDDCVGLILAFALTRWAQKFSSPIVIEHRADGKFLIEQSRSDVIINELCKTIAEGRVGICRVCERPFIVKKKRAKVSSDDPMRDMYCVGSCRVKGYKKKHE